MWTYSFHRFLNRTAFLEACDAAGIPRDHKGELDLPASISFKVLGPLIARPTLLPDGKMVPGEVIDPRYHVNLAFYGDDVPAAFKPSQVTPENPTEVFGTAPPKVALPPAVPGQVPAWKAKLVLQQMGKLPAIEALIGKAGAAARFAWDGAPSWDRNSKLLAAIAAQAGLTSEQVDEWFIAASKVES